MTGLVLADAVGLLQSLGHIAYTIVLPVLLLAGIGFVLQRRLGLDLSTLRVLNFYFVIPPVIFTAIVESPAAVGDIGTALLFSLCVLGCLGALTLLAAWLRGVPRAFLRPLLMTTLFHNSGNYGLPLQRLAFRPQGLGEQALGLQAFYMIAQNLTNFTLGILIVSGGRGRSLRQIVGHVLRFPPLYAIAAGLLARLVRGAIGPWPAGAAALRPFLDVVHYAEDAFIGVALCTLGAQLATVRRGSTPYPLGLSVCLRLLAGPAVGLALVLAFGLQGFLAQVLLIATSTPTAVNVMLLCMEFDSHPDYAARAVFYSTLLSPVTVTGTIFLARSGLLGPPGG